MLFQKIDCIRIQVPSIESALEFWEKKLGLELVWRRGDFEAGLKLQNFDRELVLTSDELGHPEVDVLVKDVD
jgi:catechol 2,3-dioxygenase-like lactoylglutathione lyase family enzyme